MVMVVMMVVMVMMMGDDDGGSSCWGSPSVHSLFSFAALPVSTRFSAGVMTTVMRLTPS